MAVLNVQKIVETGLNVTFSAAASGGDTFVNADGERTSLRVKNAHATLSRTVTVTPSTPTTTKAGFGSLTKSPLVVIVPALSERSIGPFPSPAFKDPAITYSDAAADVSVAVVKI
jgi:hypothetical protein